MAEKTTRNKTIKDDIKKFLLIVGIFIATLFVIILIEVIIAQFLLNEITLGIHPLINSFLAAGITSMIYKKIRKKK